MSLRCSGAPRVVTPRPPTHPPTAHVPEAPRQAILSWPGSRPSALAIRVRSLILRRESKTSSANTSNILTPSSTATAMRSASWLRWRIGACVAPWY